MCYVCSSRSSNSGQSVNENNDNVVDGNDDDNDNDNDIDNDDDDDVYERAITEARLWLQASANKATGPKVALAWNSLTKGIEFIIIVIVVQNIIFVYHKSKTYHFA